MNWMNWLGAGLDRQAPQHFLCFLPLPQGQGSFRTTLGCVLRTSVCGASKLEAWTGLAGQLESGAEDAARPLLRLGSLLKQAHHSISFTTSMIRWNPCRLSLSTTPSPPRLAASSTSLHWIMNGSTSSSSNALWICSSTSSGPSLVQQEAKAFQAWPGVRSSFPKRLAKYSITSSRVRWPVATNVSRPFIAADLTYSFACSFSISALMPVRSPPVIGNANETKP